MPLSDGSFGTPYSVAELRHAPHSSMANAMCHLSDEALRRLRKSPFKDVRMLAYGILVNRRSGQRREVIGREKANA